MKGFALTLGTSNTDKAGLPDQERLPMINDATFPKTNVASGPRKVKVSDWMEFTT
jgi:hypothetical protein